jgi:hypothetical protein
MLPWSNVTERSVMKANKALKRLAKIEALIADVAKRYSSGAAHIRKALQDAKAAVAHVKAAVSSQASSGKAKKTAPAKKKAAVKKAAAKTPVAKTAKKRPQVKKAAKKAVAKRTARTSVRKAPAPVQAATEPVAQEPMSAAEDASPVQEEAPLGVMSSTAS